jgi:tetratricopeptide (TPR) repeat protein
MREVVMPRTVTPRRLLRRRSSLALWAALCLAGGIASAAAAVLVLGNSKAHECYLAAKTGIDTRQGLELCNQALEDGVMTAKDVAATHVNRGVLLDMFGRYDEALDDFNKSIEFNPELGDGYLNRGVSLIRLKRLDEAFANVQKGIDLGVSVPEIGYYDRAVAEEMMGRIKDAYYDYKKCLEIAPGYTPASDALKYFVVTRVPAKPKDGPSGGT